MALELGLSQSAVSHALTRLRDLFDDPLFIRRPHGLEPTRRALELAPRIDALIDLAGETLEREAGSIRHADARRFVISAPEFITALIGAKLVNAFRKRAPNASFVVDSLAQDATLDAIRRGELDLALGRFGVQSPWDLASKLLFTKIASTASLRGGGIRRSRARSRARRDGWRWAMFLRRRARKGRGGERGDVSIAFVAVVRAG